MIRRARGTGVGAIGGRSLVGTGGRACWLCLVVFMLFDPAQSQVIPATPRKWGTRSTSGGGSASIDVIPVDPAPRKVRQTTYVVLSPLRGFSSADGRKIQGKLIAFEQSVVVRDEKPGGEKEAATEPAAANPVPASPGGKLTVVKEGKVRLLVNSKLFEYPLARLSDEDRKFIEGVRAKVEAAPVPGARPGGPEE